MAKVTSKVAKKLTSNKKAYVLDTNVLVHDPNALFSFDGVLVGIPSIVLEELDNFKREGTDRGRNSRQTVRLLDELRSHGSLCEGVKLSNGSTVRILFRMEDHDFDFPFCLESNDNAILHMAVALSHEGYQVKFISKDLNARIKSDALGLESEDYLKEHVSEEEFYHGWRNIAVPSIELKADEPLILHDLLSKKHNLTVNEFILLESQNNPHNNRVFRYLGGKRFVNVQTPKFRWPLGPRNAQQSMALNLLLDNDIQFITLFGPAGTGKTFLALLAGLHKVLVENTYEKMLISRPVVPLGRDIGFLPGDVKEKLHSWMLPIYDNMDFIVHSASARGQEYENTDAPERSFKKGKDKDKERHKHNKRDRSLMPLDELMYRGKISLEAITYMRGRSIPYQYILIDEAQNLTPHEIKTIISRVGEGSKIVIAGDPYQIDSPYLDVSSNGLVTASEKFKGQQVFGSVYLQTSERSILSQLANDLL